MPYFKKAKSKLKPALFFFWQDFWEIGESLTSQGVLGFPFSWSLAFSAWMWRQCYTLVVVLSVDNCHWFTLILSGVLSPVSSLFKWIGLHFSSSVLSGVLVQDCLIPPTQCIWSLCEWREFCCLSYGIISIMITCRPVLKFRPCMVLSFPVSGQKTV